MATGSPPGASLRRRATRGVAWSLAQSLGSRLLTATTFVILARLLNPYVFGVVAFASVAISVLTLFVQQGLGQALVQVPKLESRHSDTAFWVSLAFAVVLALGTVGISWPLAAAIDQPAVGEVLRVLSIGFLLSGLSSTPQALLQRRMAFRSLAARQLLSNTVGALTGITLALSGAGVWSLVAQTLTTAAVGVVVLWPAARWRPGRHASWATYREMFSFSANVTGTTLMGFLNRRADDLFIGAVLGPTSLGAYSVAYRLLTLLTEVSINTVSSVALPTFARIQHDLHRIRSAYTAATRLSAAIALPVFSFMAVAAPEIVIVFFGQQWVNSIDVMRVLALLGVANTLTNFNGALLTAIGRPNLVFRFMATGAIVNVAAIALVVQHGILAVAAVVVARNWVVSSPLSIYYLTRSIGMSLGDYLRPYLTPLAAAAALVGCAAVIHVRTAQALDPGARLALMAGASGVAYAVVLWVFDRPLVREFLTTVRVVIGRSGAASFPV